VERFFKQGLTETLETVKMSTLGWNLVLIDISSLVCYKCQCCRLQLTTFIYVYYKYALSVVWC